MVDSLLSAYMLNPVCVLILVSGCILEMLYCVLLQVSHLRMLVSGIVKTLGGLAAVFAVDASPDPILLLLIFLWLFFWEIGGQNVPADWYDIQEDIVTQARTVPVSLGPKIASVIVLATRALWERISARSLMGVVSRNPQKFCEETSAAQGLRLLHLSEWISGDVFSG